MSRSRRQRQRAIDRIAGIAMLTLAVTGMFGLVAYANYRDSVALQQNQS